MKQMQLSLEEISTSIMFIGFEGEQNHTQVTFYWSSIYSKYPNAVAALTIKPPVGDPYPKAITQTGNKVVWIVSASDVANSGSGEYQLTFTDDGEIIKTYIGKFTVYNSIVGNGEAPTPVEDWIEHANEALNGLGQKVTEAADAWLEENISNPDSPPLDRTLTSSVSAAPADMVGDLKRIEKAPVITDTVEPTGGIAMFTDGADGMYLHNLTVGIEPVQDLHGQANPYPPGGGKNLLDDTQVKHGTYDTSGTYSPNGNYLAYEIYLLAGTYTFSTDLADCYIVRYHDGQTNTQYMTEAQQVTFTMSANGTFKVTIRNASSSDLSNVQPKSMIESGSTATAYAPYENICPITGWTGANVQKTGKNLFDKNDSDIALNKWINNTTGNLQNSSTGYDTSGYIRVKAETTYTALGFSNADQTEVCFFDKNKIFISGISSSNHTFTTPVNTYYLRFDYKHIDVDEMMLHEGATASAYEAYQGTVYPISWQDEAGTVYGGTINPVTGVLTVGWEYGTIPSTCTEYSSSSTTGTGYFVNYQHTGYYSNTDEICIIFDALKSVTRNNRGEAWAGYAVGDGYTIFIPTGMTKTDAEEKLSGVHYLAKLNTPITYQLDPVAVATLLGVNNIYADTGAIQSVIYPADTKLYIDKRLAALGGN